VYLASAYPDSAIPLWQMLAVAVAALGALAIWISLVFLADKASSKKESARRPGNFAELARQDRAADDQQGAVDPAGRRPAA
jgi:hypothetical protein